MMAGLYVHVPFCLSKCAYCAFSSQGYEPEAADAFIDALLIELDSVPDGFVPETVFFGGGTPSVLEPVQLSRLLDGLRERIDLSALQEFSVEMNPGTVTARKTGLFREAGVSRVSLGVQSFDDRRLKLLGRAHSVRDVHEALSLIRSAGITNLNIDLMHSVPGQSAADWRGELRQALQCAPAHISCYNLMFEEGTPFQNMLERGELKALSEEEELRQYHLTGELLEAAGLMRYEISNFARPGRECRHNLLYWTGGEYYGCGPAAHSHIDGRRWSNCSDLQEYCRRIGNAGRAVDFEERLDPEQRACELLVMQLRLTAGIGRYDFMCRTGFDFMELRGAEIGALCGQGLLECDSDRLCLTGRGLFVSDAVFAELI